jgi:hypothetical protein
LRDVRSRAFPLPWYDSPPPGFTHHTHVIDLAFEVWEAPEIGNSLTDSLEVATATFLLFLLPELACLFKVKLGDSAFGLSLFDFGLMYNVVVDGSCSPVSLKV